MTTCRTRTPAVLYAGQLSCTGELEVGRIQRGRVQPFVRDHTRTELRMEVRKFLCGGTINQVDRDSS